MMENDLERLWGEGSIRAFISHISDDRIFAHDLKNGLQEYDIAAFVAHDDIEPMSEWVGVMERALFSMDLLVALLTPGFSDSNWTDQEIGVAIGRSVPVVPVRLGKDPYGFFGKFQAISGQVTPGPDDASRISTAIFEFALGDENLAGRAVDAYIAALRKSGSFARSNRLAGYMASIPALSPQQESALVHAFNANDQVYRARNILAHIIGMLKRTTGNAYEIAGERLRKLT